MNKEGVYKVESTNQRVFCVEVIHPDTINTWFEDKNGNHDCSDNNWWDMEITPKKFHWLVDQWNEGNIQKTYSFQYDKAETKKEHINSLLQLTINDLINLVCNYAAYILPHHRWTSELELNSNIRPVYQNGKIIRFEDISYEEACKHNIKEKQDKKYRADMVLYGRTDDEYIKEQLSC